MKDYLKIPAQLLLCFSLMLHCPQLFAQALPELIPYVDNGKWGYADTNGNVRIKPQWDHAGFFEHDIATTWFNKRRRNIHCLVNKKGEYIISPERNWNGSVFRSFAEAKYVNFNTHNSKEKYGVIDDNGRMVIPCIYDMPENNNSPNNKEWRWSGTFQYDSLRGRFCAIAMKNGKAGLIDTNNRVLIPFEYDGLYRVFDKYNCPPRFYNIVMGNKHGLIDTANNMIVPPIYDNVMFSSHDHHKGIWLWKDKRRLIADTTGKIIIDAPGYSADFPQDSLIPAYRIDGRHGVLNFKHEEVIPCIYYHTAITNDSIILRKDSVIANREGKYIFRQYLDTKTLRPLTDWFSDDYRLQPVAPKTVTSETPTQSGRPYQMHIGGKDISTFEKDGILWSATSYMQWPEGFNLVSGIHTKDSTHYTGSIDTNGKYVMTPVKGRYRISYINARDSLLVIQQTDNGGKYGVTDFYFKEKVPFRERDIQTAFIYDKRFFFVVTDGTANDYSYNGFRSGSPIYRLQSGDSALTEKFKQYALVAFCDKNGLHNTNGWQHQPLFAGYFMAKQGERSGIIDINADVVYPKLSFKYQQFTPQGFGLFHVRTSMPDHRYSRFVTTPVQTGYPMKGEPYLVDTENTVLLDSMTVEWISRVRISNNGKVEKELPLFQIALKDYQSEEMQMTNRRNNWFYMDIKGRGYYGSIMP